MRTPILVVAVTLGLYSCASAEVRFQGGINTVKAEDCEYTKPGDFRTSRLRVPGLDGATSGGLTFMYDGGGYAVAFADALPKINKPATVDSADVGEFGIFAYKTKITFTKIEPEKLDDSAKSVYIEGEIEEPFGEKGSPGKCVVTFRASLLRRP